MVSALVAMFLMASPEHFYTVAGSVELRRVADETAVEVGDEQALSRTLGQFPTVAAERIFRHGAVLAGARDPAHLTRALAETRSVSRFLAVYRAVDTGERLIADGKIRARFDPELGLGEIEARALAAGAAGVRVLRPGEGLCEVIAPTPDDTVAVAAELQESGAALWAHPDFFRRSNPLWVPNDTLFANQWHHDMIGSRAAWDLVRGSPDVMIAVPDTGMDMAHPDLAAKVVWPRDTWADGGTPDDDPTPSPYDAHGTGTAGIAAAVTDNALGIAGVCPSCSLMPIRIMDEAGNTRDSAKIDAFYWAADHGAQVISNSWGIGAQGQPTPVPQGLADAIAYAAANTKSKNGTVTGSVITFATGNENRETKPFELSSLPLVLGVGATNDCDLRQEKYSNYGSEMDLVAPAASYTTDIHGDMGYNPQTPGGGPPDTLTDRDYVSFFGGTSAASPVVAGVAGLVFSVNPDLSRSDVATILTKTANKVGGVQYTNGVNLYYGYGRVNALRAVQMARGDKVCQPVKEVCSNTVDDDCDGLVDREEICCAPPTEIGAPCTEDAECGYRGVCLISPRFLDGYCTNLCSGQSACPDTAGCAEIGYTSPVCIKKCERVSDCREGYTCYSVALCLPACPDYHDCGTDTCNEYGLCGDDAPPVVDPPPPPPPPPPSDECMCDTSTACDKDGKDDCACDPECKGGCAATPPSLVVVLAALALARRRRKRR